MLSSFKGKSNAQCKQSSHIVTIDYVSANMIQFVQDMVGHTIPSSHQQVFLNDRWNQLLDDRWNQAIQEGMDALILRGMWELVDPQQSEIVMNVYCQVQV